MATTAQDNGSNGTAAKPPISTHRAFPFIVALWFAALLGLGSLMVPVEVIERLVVASGISSVVSQASPPLGFTARALIALVFTAAGAVAGLLIARQVAKAHRGEMGGGRRPIAAHDELGDEGFDGAPRRGRRALAIQDDGEGRSEFLDFAPLPGVGDNIVYEPSAGDEQPEDEAFDLTEEQFEEADEPVELAEEMPDELFAEASVEQDTNPGFASLDEAEGEDEVIAERQEFIAISEAEPEQETAEEPAFDQAWSEQDDSDDEAEPFAGFAEEEPLQAADFSMPPAEEEPVETELQDFAGNKAEAPAAETHDSFEDLPEMTDEHAAFAHGSDQDSGGEKPEWQSAPLEELGLVQLAQRLGASIEKRREMRHARAALAASTAHTPRAVPADIEPRIAPDVDVAGAEDAAQAMAAFFNKPDSEPAQEPQDFAMPRGFDAPEQAPQPQADPFARFHVEEEAEEDETDNGWAQEAEEEPEGEITRQVFQPLADETPEARAPYQANNQFSHLSLPDDDEDEDDGSLAASFSLPLNRMQRDVAAESVEPEVAAEEPAEEAWDEADYEEEAVEAEDEGAEFGSLIGMDNPFRKRSEEFVRIEDEPEMEEGAVEPAVVFPSEARAFDRPAQQASEAMKADNPLDTEENERALREALLNLQRMRGAG